MKTIHLVLAASLLAGIGYVAPPVLQAEAHELGRSAFYFCKSGIGGNTAVKSRKNKAKQRATEKWENKVKRAYGTRYAKVRLAREKHHHCRKKHGTWRCRFIAHPCSQAF